VAADYLSYLVENEVKVGFCIPCVKNRNMDKAKFFSNMQLDGGIHLYRYGGGGQRIQFLIPAIKIKGFKRPNEKTAHPANRHTGYAVLI